jgi:hypothetical protein
MRRDFTTGLMADQDRSRSSRQEQEQESFVSYHSTLFDISHLIFKETNLATSLNVSGLGGFSQMTIEKS